MIKTCVTGNIGSGKSTVCKVLASAGVPVFNCDEESKKLLYKNLNKIIDLFGDSVFENGEFKKSLLSKIVFADKEKLNQLNAILHPLVHDEIENFYEKNKNEKFVVVENAILFETGSQDKFDYVVTVVAEDSIRLKRAMLRDNISEDEVRAKMNNQLSQEHKVYNSDFIIPNNGEQSELNSWIMNFYDIIMNSKNIKNEKQNRKNNDAT